MRINYINPDHVLALIGMLMEAVKTAPFAASVWSTGLKAGVNEKSR
jgi:hypothetical protein